MTDTNELKQDIRSGLSDLTEGLAALRKLATEWASEGNFLDGEDDHREDKIRGKVYKECANELKALIGG